MDGSNANRRSDMPGSYTPVCRYPTETFCVACDADIEGKECRAVKERVSGIDEEVLGDAYLGERIFCNDGGVGQRNDSKICQKPTGRADTRRTTRAMER